MAVLDVYVDGVLRERWDNTAPGSMQRFDGAGNPEGVPEPITASQLDVLNKKIERRDLLAAALNAYNSNTAYLAGVTAGTVTTAQALAQVARLTEQVNALIKLVGQDILNLDGSQG